MSNIKNTARATGLVAALLASAVAANAQPGTPAGLTTPQARDLVYQAEGAAHQSKELQGVQVTLPVQGLTKEDAAEAQTAPSGSGHGPSPVVAGIEHGGGRGTIQLPQLDSLGLLVANLLSADGGARYGLDAELTTWIPSETAPELMFGGLYGRMFAANPEDGPFFKARVEGTWRMVSDGVGQLDAAVIADGPAGGQVIGSVRGKFLVHRQGREAGVSIADPHPAPLSGNLGLHYVLAN